MFFCDRVATAENPTFRIESEKAKYELFVAITKTKSKKFQLKRSSAIDVKDAYAIDVHYHKGLMPLMYIIIKGLCH